MWHTYINISSYCFDHSKVVDLDHARHCLHHIIGHNYFNALLDLHDDWILCHFEINNPNVQV